MYSDANFCYLKTGIKKAPVEELDQNPGSKDKTEKKLTGMKWTLRNFI